MTYWKFKIDGRPSVYAYDSYEYCREVAGGEAEIVEVELRSGEQGVQWYERNDSVGQAGADLPVPSVSPEGGAEAREDGIEEG